MHNISKWKISVCFVLSSFLFMANVNAAAKIALLQTKHTCPTLPKKTLEKIIKSNIDLSQFRNVKVQIINNSHGSPYILAFLSSKKHHGLEVRKIILDSQMHVVDVIENYELTEVDYSAQPGFTSPAATCPDTAVQFISFAPNDDEFELNIARDVANYAESKGLKTVRLLLNDATRATYLNYMACPNLKGNFYDGDANPYLITTADGFLWWRDINNSLNKQFKYKVTNIWLACKAFINPMKTSMLDTSQSQKYAAGVNNLLVGPSDNAAACAMKAALDNKPMTSSFIECYNQFDTKEDIWGFEGLGADYFGA